jgi:dolichol kinase
LEKKGEFCAGMGETRNPFFDWINSYAVVLFFGSLVGLFLCAGMVGVTLVFSWLAKKNLLPRKAQNMLALVHRMEENAFPGKGALTFFLGIAFLLALNETVFDSVWVTVGGMIPLVVGDSTATLAGTSIGKRRLFNQKTVEGTIAGMLATVTALWMLFPMQPVEVVVVALAAAVVELLPLDDNLFLPVVSGTLLFLFL